MSLVGSGIIEWRPAVRECIAAIASVDPEHAIDFLF
jgi:hypothetical protein